jgi:PDZ domain-containing protein
VTVARKNLSGALLLTGLTLLLVVAVLWFWPSGKYLFLPDVAHPVDPLVTVPASAAKQRDRDRGGIYFVDVIVRKASLLEQLFPQIHDGADLVPANQVVPPGSNDKQRRTADLREMSRSQSIAAAVALRALGRKVDASPTGVLIDGVDPDAPAAKVLHPGDRIVAVDGRRVRTPADLRRLIQVRRPGSTVRLALDDGQRRRVVAVETTTSRDKRTVIGVIVEQAVAVKLPIKIEIDAGSIGGPSAGVAFALDIMEELGRDVDRGHKVAATGELALDGTVLPVGGLKQKTIGARRANVDLFLVPAGDNARVARRYAGNLRVVAVKSFQQALSALATLPSTG